jgi:integrase
MKKYKHGKKTEIQSFQYVARQVEEAKLSMTDEAYFWLLYYCGVRKSEGYERVTEDFKITDTHLIVDFHQRKKHGATVDPLEFPRSFPGIDKLILAIEKATSRNQTSKSIFTYENHKRVKHYRKARWVFPEIQSTKAWSIIRKVLGVGFYPHFLRLNRLSEISGDPTANLLRLKSFSGIKSTNVLDSYLGTSKKEQQKAIEFMSSKMQGEVDNGSH